MSGESRLGQIYRFKLDPCCSRWVKFQEDVEDGGKRWSKPYVPALKLSALMDLKHSLEEGIVGLDVDGKYIDEIVGERSQHVLLCDRLRTCLVRPKYLSIGGFVTNLFLLKRFCRQN